MKAVKILVGLLVAALAVVAVVVVLALQNINEIVKVAVETVGPEVIGTQVKLAEVDIKITEGRGELKGLSVANPAGYTQPFAFSLGEIALDIDPASVTKDVIVIDEILVSSAQIFAEYKDTKNNNLQALLDNLSSGGGPDTAPVKEESAKPVSEPAEDVLLAVTKFTFEGTTITVTTPQWGERQVKLPAIRLANLGSASKGLTPEALAETVVSQLLQQAKQAVTADLKAMVKEKGEAELKAKLDEKLSDKNKEKLEGLKSLFKR